MPTIVEFIRAEKNNVKIGEWHTCHIAPSFFPLSQAKRKNYRFGSEYAWRVVTFECLGHKCRILILYNESKNICRSTFGVDVEKDVAVLCTHEYHADHPGWHCHLTRKDHSLAIPGSFRSGQQRWPGARVPHSRREFGVTRASALTQAAERYGLRAQGDLL